MIQFLDPAMLWALPVALAPLLLRQHRAPREPPTVPFAAMRFLRVAKPAPAHHRLLTAIRITLLAFLSLAFTRPYFSSPVPHASSVSSVAILADNRTFLEAALGSVSTNGNRVLDFAPRGTVQTGNVTIAPGPYFHPALLQIGSLHSVHVHRWVKLPVEGRTIVLIRLSNGDPFLTEDDGIIRCAVAADPEWSDLPFHVHFVPLVNELVRYLANTPPLRRSTILSSDLGRPLLLLVLVFALLEMALGGFSGWKLIPLLVLLLVLLHPTFTWPALKGNSTATICDSTESVVTRDGAHLCSSDDVTLTGDTTDLGDAILSLTNRPLTRLILCSDGQHNHGVDPVWAAAQLGVPVVIPFDLTKSPRDISITQIECPAYAVAGQTIEVTATITATGYGAPLLNVSLDFFPTNVPPGVVTFRVPVATGSHEIHVQSLDGEASEANNYRLLPITIIEHPLRIFLQSVQPDWEYQQVRHVLANDPFVSLVSDPNQADSIIATTNATWRLRRWGDAAFAAYWHARIQSLLPSLPEPKPVSEELYHLTRNEELLRDIARVSGGELQGVVNSWPYQGEDRFDLRDSWVILMALLAGFLGAWAWKRVLN